jgi:hypothetical protein
MTRSNVDAAPRLVLHFTPDFAFRLEAAALREKTSTSTSPSVLAYRALRDWVAASEAKVGGVCPACESKPVGRDGRAAFCSDHRKAVCP